MTGVKSLYLQSFSLGRKPGTYPCAVAQGRILPFFRRLLS